MESIKQMFQKMLQDNISKSIGRNNNKAPLIAQGHDKNGLLITYYWYHGIASNLYHNRKSCRCQKEGQKLNPNYQNHMVRCTERCRVHRELIRGSAAGSNNNTVKNIKLLLLQKVVVSAIS